MLDITTVDKIAARVAAATLHKDNLSRVMSTRSTDQDGQEALQVKIVIRSAEPQDIDGDMVIDLMAGLQRALQEAGDERFAYVDFATEQEMLQDGGP